MMSFTLVSIDEIEFDLTIEEYEEDFNIVNLELELQTVDEISWEINDGC